MKKSSSRQASVLVLVITMLSTVAGLAQPSSIRVNEVMASLGHWCGESDLVSGWVELFNPTPTDIDLADASLTEDLILPRRFVFPPGSVVPATGFLVVTCAQAAPGPGQTGFPLRSNGGVVYLFDTPAHGGALVDGIQYGIQTVDYSVGRVPDGGSAWTLNLPSPGASNAAAAVGSPAGLRINEWMSATTWGADWFELYNPGSLPVALGELYLSDDLLRLTKHHIAALSYIGTGARGGYAVFFADSNPALGANHVGFKLSAYGEPICLTAADGVTIIDSIMYFEQPLDISQGRLPDGSTNIVLFTPQVARWTATPGGPNPFPSILLISHSPVRLQFHMPSNLTCTVEYQDNGAGPWLDLTNIAPAAVNRSLEIGDSASAAAQRSYRLRKD